MIYQYRVIFGDTDQMGVVYYANYLRIFEGARAEYWRSLGRTHKDIEAWNVALPVVEAQCSYKSPSRYEDLLDVHTEIFELRHASLRFSYSVRRGADLIAEGATRHAVVGLNGRPRKLPDELRAIIASGQVAAR